MRTVRQVVMGTPRAGYGNPKITPDKYTKGVFTVSVYSHSDADRIKRALIAEGYAAKECGMWYNDPPRVRVAPKNLECVL